MTSSGWTVPRRRRWGSRRAGWRPTRWAWCSQRGFRARTWPACPSSWWRAWPLDTRVRDRIIADTHGNPLALLELPRGLTPAELTGGFGVRTAAVPLAGRIEENFTRQLEALPAQTQRLVQLAAADPTGDPVLVWRAAGRLAIGAGAAEPAAKAGLAEFGARVRFRHPLVRSAAYRSASVQTRQQLHGALAEATDPAADPDRRAWHRAEATPGPDEEVAAELEQSAGRAQ